MSPAVLGCTPACWAMPECRWCGLRKPPRGRSVAPAAANSYCNRECPGYHEEPHAGHLWPGELAEDGGI